MRRLDAFGATLSPFELKLRDIGRTNQSNVGAKNLAQRARFTANPSLKCAHGRHFSQKSHREASLVRVGARLRKIFWAFANIVVLLKMRLVSSQTDHSAQHNPARHVAAIAGASPDAGAARRVGDSRPQSR